MSGGCAGGSTWEVRVGLKRVLFVYNSEKPGAEEVARGGVDWCRTHGLEAVLTPRREFSAEEVDLVVAVGGDGTLLRAAATIYPREIPILGVHMGSLGFLACCGAEELERALELVMKGKSAQERHLRLAIQGRPETALNDVAILGTAEVRFTELSVWSGGEEILAFPGDGLVVATPTGASAYALSCGGPLVHPRVEALIVAPVAPHRLDVRPLILPADQTVQVKVHYPAELWVDGDTVKELPAGGQVEIKVAAAQTVLVRLPEEEGYFTRLRRRLS